MINQELLEKKEKAEKIIRELNKFETNNYLPVIIEALGFYIEKIDLELKTAMPPEELD